MVYKFFRGHTLLYKLHEDIINKSLILCKENINQKNRDRKQYFLNNPHLNPNDDFPFNLTKFTETTVQTNLQTYRLWYADYNFDEILNSTIHTLYLDLHCNRESGQDNYIFIDIIENENGDIKIHNIGVDDETDYYIIQGKQQVLHPNIIEIIK